MARRERTSDTKAGYVYVLSNEAMPGIVKIGMTQRHPDTRLREINAATGVLPFRIEAVIESRNARWTEKAVHEKLVGRRVNERREFFKVDVGEATRIISSVARQQGLVAHDRKSWSGGVPFMGGMLMGALMMPAISLLDIRLLLPWLALCMFTALTNRKGALGDYMRISRWISKTTLVALAAISLTVTAWMQQVTVSEIRTLCVGFQEILKAALQAII